MKTINKWMIFTLVAIAQFMVVLDNAITNVALPSIRQQLGFTTETLQWVVTAYALAFGGFLLLGGRIADLYGRRLTLLSGMTAFTVFSFLIGISQEPWQLVVLRAFQGLSAAFMSPAALSIVLVTFRDGDARNRALSYWTLVSTGGAALGLLLGGALTQYFGWRWNFFINVPIGIAMVALIARYVPVEEKEEKEKTLDIRGAVLVTSSLMLLVLAFSQAPIWGWLSLGTISSLVIAGLLLGAFIYNESKVPKPLMPLSIFRIRNVRGANLIMAPLFASMLSSFFLLTLYLQGTMHLDPLMTGLAFLPFPLTLATVASQMPKLVKKYGFKRFLIIGPIIVVTGLLYLTQLTEHSTYLLGIFPATILIPLGIGMTMMPTIAAATSGVPADESGIASGLVSTSQQMGGALGLSILSGVAASVTTASMNLGINAAVIQGYHIAFIVSAGFMALAAIAALLVIKDRRPQSSVAHTQLQTSASH
ncbi:MAG: EmrB/QacA subfamily drug resistance transporter [Candidatus Saccharibacteria bacterium]|nr:EmrB/QacA subfamily drug resistance transporter [Candidatus Saccharibacteria bacterium]